MTPITITGMETTDNSIRHPKFIDFRNDISIEDCQWSKNIWRRLNEERI